MKYSWIDAELLQKPSVTKDLQAEWNWIRYHIGGKMFAAVCLDDATGKPVYITCKLDPAEGDFLRRQYKDIIPGYYMNKVHWNSVKADGNVPDALLREMLENLTGWYWAASAKRSSVRCWKERRKMPFDYKKEYKEFYLPTKKPQIVTVPAINFVAVQGKGDPNDPAGEYKAAMELLYGIAFTIKMSYKGSHKMDGYFEYVVPPLEGLWHQPGTEGVDFSNKETFIWTSMIRLPEFVTRVELTGQCRKPPPKRKKTFLRWSFLPTMKVCACSVCTSAPTTPSRRPCGSWMRLQRSRDIARIFQTRASITRSIWATRAALHRRS